jgi:hypothetical protein
MKYYPNNFDLYHTGRYFRMGDTHIFWLYTRHNAKSMSHDNLILSCLLIRSANKHTTLYFFSGNSSNHQRLDLQRNRFLQRKH